MPAAGGAGGIGEEGVGAAGAGTGSGTLSPPAGGVACVAGAAERDGTGAPQALQNFLPDANGAPQAGHFTGVWLGGTAEVVSHRGSPQILQYFLPGEYSVWHVWQYIGPQPHGRNWADYTALPIVCQPAPLTPLTGGERQPK